ncbi:unnamed protein product [Caenorhabditis auriculariae]|uniref:Uncharacterized protein n=1 Tax=Caenorhabditis auriculariae TaxID=2777116 RepID=A0A8S1GPH3_9PELO|nr:unnamed protein product [Caenorhabditis auriculariae]
MKATRILKDRPKTRDSVDMATARRSHRLESAYGDTSPHIPERLPGCAASDGLRTRWWSRRPTGSTKKPL